MHQNTYNSRRKALLECCFPEIGADSALPTANAYAKKVSANPQFRLTDDKESRKEFNSLCLNIRNNKRTEAILEEVGSSPGAYVVPVNMRVNFWQHA